MVRERTKCNIKQKEEYTGNEQYMGLGNTSQRLKVPGESLSFLVLTTKHKRQQINNDAEYNISCAVK